MKLKTFLISAILFSLLSAGTLLFEKEFDRSSLEMEFGLHYLPLDYIIYLTKEDIPTIDPESEKGVYSFLLKNFFRPRFLLLEASIYPFPILGWSIQTYWPELYTRAKLNERVNLIESLTAVYYEPWALALFLGNIAKFNSKNDKTSSGKGYTGLLVCYGNYYLKANKAIKDHWLEIEYKLKGSVEQEIKTLKWSFRIGSRIHFNNLIKDTLYLSFFRDRTDFKFRKFSLIKNSYYELRWDTGFKKQLDLNSFHLIRQTTIIGKKFPIKLKKRDKIIAPSISIGLIWQRSSDYLGSLSDNNIKKFTLVVVPKVEF